jgi:hypothetical protein
VPSSQSKALSSYRRRLKRDGIVRLEVKVRQQDVPLVRGVVAALADPQLAAETRALLCERFAGGRAAGLKALLAAAPLEGIDLAREPDRGRDIPL